MVDVPRRRSDAQPVTELSALVLAAHDAGNSYERMAARARREPDPQVISGSYLHQIAWGRVRVPSKNMVPAIAKALGMTENQVREAIARDANLHVAHNIDSRTGTLLSTVGELSPANRDRWHRLGLALAKELAAEEDGSLAGRTVALSPPGVPSPSRESAVAMDEVLVAAEERARKAASRRKRS